MSVAQYDATGRTPILAGRVPADLVQAARDKLGRPDAGATELIRAGLASLAGLDIEQHSAPMPTGPRVRQAKAENAA
jgi:hypothetical protein